MTPDQPTDMPPVVANPYTANQPANETPLINLFNMLRRSKRRKPTKGAFGGRAAHNRARGGMAKPVEPSESTRHISPADSPQ